MIVRSQAEQCTRIPERLLQPLFEHTDDYSGTPSIDPGVNRRKSLAQRTFRNSLASAMLVG
jgi:hypothetical protein